ncbi:hypothetical protein KCU87_g92, partial [Aureobasidium melanogenum]
MLSCKSSQVVISNLSKCLREEDIQPAQTCFGSVGRVIAVLGAVIWRWSDRKVSRQVRPRCGLRWSLDSSSLSRAYITSANIHVVCY